MDVAAGTGTRMGIYCALLGIWACSSPNDGNGATSGSGGGSPIIGVGSGGMSAAPGSGGGMAPIGGTGGSAPVGSGGVASMPMGSGGATSAGAGGMQATTDAGMMPSDAGGMGTGGSGSSAQMLPAITDYTQDGPFTVAPMEANVGPSNNYTIFRPDPLGENGFLHSPIIFGPGIITGPSLYATLLNHLASHGFVTICVNALNGGPGDPGNLDAMKMGLEWLIAQNSQAGSVYEGKLAVDRAITMGYSVGATASTQLSSHAAIMTTVSIHGHNTMGDPHGPIWLTTGTMDVIDDNRTTLTTLTEAPAIMTALPIGHLDVPTEIAAGGRYIAPITAWLRYWVNGDEGAKNFFLGDSCKVCTDPWIAPETNDMWKALK